LRDKEVQTVNSPTAFSGLEDVMAFSVTCPQCHAILSSAGPAPADKKIKCSKCNTSFAASFLENAIAVGNAPIPANVPAAAAPNADGKKGRSVRMLIGIIGMLAAAPFLFVVGCGGCGGLGYFAYYIAPRRPIIGSWEQVNNPWGLLVVKTFDPWGRCKEKQGGNWVETYQYHLDGNTLTFDREGGVGARPSVQWRCTVTLADNEMILTDLHPGRPPERFRRIE